MAVRKRCTERVCQEAPLCHHPWWLDVMHRGTRYRINVNTYAASRSAGRSRPILRYLDAKRWERRLRREIAEGGDPRGRTI